MGQRGRALALPLCSICSEGERIFFPPPLFPHESVMLWLQLAHSVSAQWEQKMHFVQFSCSTKRESIELEWWNQGPMCVPYYSMYHKLSHILKVHTHTQTFIYLIDRVLNCHMCQIRDKENSCCCIHRIPSLSHKNSPYHCRASHQTLSLTNATWSL